MPQMQCGGVVAPWVLRRIFREQVMSPFCLSVLLVCVFAGGSLRDVPVLTHGLGLPANVKPCAAATPMARRWATKKGGGSSKNGRKSPGKRLGVKKFEGMCSATVNTPLRIVRVGRWGNNALACALWARSLTSSTSQSFQAPLTRVL